MDYRTLHAFCDIAEHGSLTRAAAVLGETQSGLSRRISNMETQMGGRLFHRTGRGMVLTALGERIRPQARDILAQIDALVKDAQGERDSPSGTVEFGVVSGMSRPLVSMLCARLNKEFPGIHLRALEGYSGQIEEWLANGRIELGIFNSYGRSTMRGAELLLQSSVALVAPRGIYPVSEGEIPFSALRDLPLVLPTQPNKLAAAVIDIAAQQRFTLRVLFEASTGALVRDAVEQTRLCTLVPLHQAQRDYAAGNFTVARVIKPVIQQKAWLVLSTQRPASRAARVVARLVRELAAHIAGNVPPLQDA